MNRPGFGVRVAGSPLGALMLLAMYAAVIFGWYQGEVAWWVGVAAVAAAGRTVSAIGTVRRYKLWAADWRGMGEEGAPKKRGRVWMRVIVALLLVIGIPAWAPQIRNNLAAIPFGEALANALVALWLAACLYLVWRLVRTLWVMLRRSASSAAERRREKAENAPVAWLVGLPSSSPSRAEAERELPEYCAGLLGPQIEEGEEYEQVS